ncbi:MAG: hypothetical protein R3F39_00530 [Myxococcota bacterium]
MMQSVVSCVLAMVGACGGEEAPEAGAEGAGADGASAEAAPPTQDPSNMMWLEVHEMLTRSLELSLHYQELDRAKALAIQALATAGENTSLGAAAQLACALAEEARRDKKTALRHLRAAVDILPANALATDAVIGAVIAAANVGGETAQTAREALDAWQARLETASQPEALEAVTLAAATLKADAAKPPPPKEIVEVVVDPPPPEPESPSQPGPQDGLEYPVFIE